MTISAQSDEFRQSRLGSPWRSHWCLDPDVTFLNHGSFGACPTVVLEQQRSLREQLEREPVYFFAKVMEPLLDEARQTLADFVGAPAEALAFVPNATTGINAVLRSLCHPSLGAQALGPGDELLTTDHEYNASRNVFNFVADWTGATVVVADVPFPIASPQAVIDALLAKVSARTKLVLIDHVSSQTALIFPLPEIIQALSARGIDVLVDGAHAPGMIPLNLSELGAAYYTGNCHKWLCAPKGAAFLYVRPDRQSAIRPMVISHGANSPRRDRSQFQLEFDWMGTSDPTAYLSVPTALQFMGSLLPGGWEALMAHNHQLALEARDRLCAQLQCPIPAPDAMLGSMAAIPLSDGDIADLATPLWEQFKIQVPINPWHRSPNRLLRVSAQLYNTPAEYDYLADALSQLLDIPPSLT